MANIYEVAKEAGVSPKTAARILSGEASRSRSAPKVMKAAQRLGYIRNQQAANLRSGLTKLIGLVVPDLSNPFYPKFIQTIHDTALQAGYQILFSSTFGDPAEEIRALRLLQQYRVDGLIFNAGESETNEECEAALQHFITNNKPVIITGRTAGKLPIDQVSIANGEGMKKLIRYLVKTGHKRIAFVDGPRNTMAFTERFEGFLAALDEHKLTAHEDLISFGEATTISACDRVTRLLQSSTKRPDAIVSANDILAIGTLKSVLKLGLRVPQDIAVTGFDDIPMVDMIHPGLTTLRQPQDEIARDCVKLIIERIKNKDLANPRLLQYEPDLIIRDSA